MQTFSRRASARFHFIFNKLVLLAVAGSSLFSAYGAVNYVQGNYSVPPSGSVVNTTFAAAQTAGNLNVVAVGWSDAVSP